MYNNCHLLHTLHLNPMNQNTRVNTVINACFVVGILFFIIHPIIMQLGWHGVWFTGFMKLWMVIVGFCGLTTLAYLFIFASELDTAISAVTGIASVVIAYLTAHTISIFTAKDILYNKVGILGPYLSDVLSTIRDLNFVILFVLIAMLVFYIVSISLLYAHTEKLPNTRKQIHLFDDKANTITFLISIIFMISAALYTVLNHYNVESSIADYILNMGFHENHYPGGAICENLPINVEVYLPPPNQNQEMSAIVRTPNTTGYSYIKTVCKQP